VTPQADSMRRSAGRRDLLVRCTIAGIIILLARVLVPPARAQLASSPWPMFHHDLQHTGLSAFDTSANIGALKWQSSGGLGRPAPWYLGSSAAVGADGTIYVGGHSLYAINPDGSTKWTFPGTSFSSPAIGADGTIYVGLGSSGTLLAVNPDGGSRWVFDVPFPPLATECFVISSPAVATTGTIYFGAHCANRDFKIAYAVPSPLLAINPDGSQKWTFQTTSAVSSSPAVGADGTIYVGSWDGNLYAINPDGSQKWVLGVGTENPLISSPAVAADGTIYIGSNQGLYAINPDGSQKWKFAADTRYSSPAVGGDGGIYIGSDDKNVYAINPDGSEKWSFATGYPVKSSPAVGADGTIYVGSEVTVYAINPGGSQKWDFSVYPGNVFDSSPAVAADGTIYIGSSGDRLYALGPYVALSGSGSFGEESVGITTAANKFTLANQRGITLGISGISATGDFAISSNTCGSSLEAAATCTISVVFTPTVSGTRTGTLIVDDDASNSPQTASLSGVGTTILLLTPPSLSFPVQPVGTTSPAQKLSLTNKAGVKVPLSVFASSDFAVSATTCGTSLEPLASCSIAVKFKPTATGTRTGTLTVSDSADNSPQTSSLSGIGTVVLALTPPSLSFPAQLVGTTSPAQKLSLTNKAGVALPISIAASGDFHVSSTTCGSSLGPLAGCTISVSFRPTSIGPRTGTLKVTDSAENSPQTAGLNGTGTWITASPTTLPFGNQLVGTTSGAKDVTFTNKGAALIYIYNASASGDFAASSTTCGASLGAGSTCAVSVRFAPSAAGKRTGVLTVHASAPVPTVGLSGTGTLSPTPTPTKKPTATPTPIPGYPFIKSIPKTILVGGNFIVNGSNFTPGSVANFFVATSTGPINAGPFTPISKSATQLIVNVPSTTTLGQGFVDVQVVNTDKSFRVSNLAAALLQGSAAAGIPSITAINGVGLAATSSDPNFATNNVETVIPQDTVVKLGGTGFDTANGVAVDVFCACPGGKVGPFFLNPGNPGLSKTLISFTLPATGAMAPPTGPGSFVMSNKGADGKFSKKSNAVSVPIGHQISVTSVTQLGSTITVNGKGFSTLTVINFFNAQGGGVVNLGGLKAGGGPKIPLTLVNQTRFTFTKPAGAMAGAAFVQALNPPFVPFTSSGNTPNGAFTVK
jgi:outer membrane protein assembly factor BamB